ncbi:MAG: hypothetical protein HY222_01635 [Thaumarchaeota archaeon]|nr:hypothetical protein [Nitrososphaerota archaeon]MBI3641076.1 hypothetical protein [Nitrososphaerota archaeon]
MSNDHARNFAGCVILILVGLALIYIWQNYIHEWIIVVAGIVLIIFGIIAGIKTFFN